MTLTPSRMRYSVALATLALTAASHALQVDSGVCIAAIAFAGGYVGVSKGGETLQAMQAKAAAP